MATFCRIRVATGVGGQRYEIAKTRREGRGKETNLGLIITSCVVFIA